MAESIKIQLSDKYQPVTEADIRTAKNFVLRRESASNGLGHLVDGLLEDAAEEITRLCYQFNVDPKTFQISSSYNERLFELISNILDQLEDDILELLLDYSTRCTESEKKKSSLLPWILALGMKGRRRNAQSSGTYSQSSGNQSGTSVSSYGGLNVRGISIPFTMLAESSRDGLVGLLEKRLWNFSRDIEAMIIACRMAGLDSTKAISRIKSNIKSVYTIPEMKHAFAHSTQQKNTFIRTRGVKHGNVGNSNSEAVNIIRMVRYTVQKAWMHQRYQDFSDKDGIWGYAVRRGSFFNCAICDSHVGEWPIENKEHFPLFHYNCQCFAFPIYYRDRENQ